jgi:hypothetical protein
MWVIIHHYQHQTGQDLGKLLIAFSVALNTAPHAFGQRSIPDLFRVLDETRREVEIFTLHRLVVLRRPSVAWGSCLGHGGIFYAD